MFLTSSKTAMPTRSLAVAIIFSVGSLLSIVAGTFAQGRAANEHGCVLIDKNHPAQFISYEGPADSVEIRLRLRNNSGCAIIVETDDVLPTQMKRDQKGALRFGEVTDSRDGVKLRLHYLVQDRNRQAAPKPAYGWGDSVFTYEILAGQSVVFTIPASQLKQSFDIAVPFNYTGEGRTSVGMGVGGVTHRVYFLVDDLPPDVLHDNVRKTAMLASAANFSTARARTSGKPSKVDRPQEPLKSYTVISHETHERVLDIVFHRDQSDRDYDFVLRFEPSFAPESEILVKSAMGNTTVIRYTSLSGNIFQRLNRIIANGGKEDPIEMAKLIEVKKQVVNVPAAQAALWRKSLSESISSSVRVLEERSEEAANGIGTVMIDGTLYKLRYKQDGTELSFAIWDDEVRDAEVTGELQVVRWMNGVRRDVDAIPTTLSAKKR